MQAKNFKNSFGFSLLEVLLAVGVLAILIAFSIRLLSNQLDTRERIKYLDMGYHEIHTAMNFLFTDIQNAYIIKNDDARSLNLSKRKVIPYFYYMGSDLILFRKNYQSIIRNSPESNFAAVKYVIRDHPTEEKKKQLLRFEDINLVEDIESQFVGQKGVLVEDLKEFRIEFYDGSDYIKSWNTKINEFKGFLPKKVKVHLEIWTPISEREQQMLAFKSAAEKEKRKKFLSLESIVYIESTQGQKDVKRK